MFQFIKKYFFVVSTFLNVLSYISMTNKECKVRPKIIYVNSNVPIFYTFSIKTSKCRGGCNDINDPYAKIFVPDVVKDLNVTVLSITL